MSANQRRSGFRLPWLSDADEPGGTSSPAEAAASPEAPNAQPAAPAPQPAVTNGSSSGGQSAATPERAGDAAAAMPDVPAGPLSGEAPDAAPAAPPPSPGADAAPSAPDAASAHETAAGAATSTEPPGEFLRELIAAMRRVADETRQAGVAKLRSEAEEAVRALEADTDKRRQELRERAEADVTGVGEWARAETERIKAEAEQRVAARRSQLEQQLAAEGTRTEAETKALRARVDDYERELEAYYAQLSEISDPAAFAAAAKRMPAPPELAPRAAEPVAAPSEPGPPATPAASAPKPPAEATEPPSEPAATAAAEVHPAEEEVLAARLAELDQKLEAAKAAETKEPAERNDPTATVAEAAPVSTDIVVKGLGSFGAITGFRQSLSGQPGISAVALSLGQSGEFVFRATHAPGFDLTGAIKALEGDGATIEPRPEGGLRVTLERAR